MVRSSSTPATNTKTAPRATSSRRRIDQAIRRSIMGASRPYPCRASPHPASRIPLPGLHPAHVQAHPHLEHESLNRRGEVRLRVEEERRRGHDLVAWLQTLDDLDERVTAEPHTNLPGHEPAVAAVHEDEVLRPGGQHRLERHAHPPPARRREP